MGCQGVGEGMAAEDWFCVVAQQTVRGREAFRLEKLSTTKFTTHSVRAGSMPGLYSETLCKCLPGGCV